MFALSIIGVIAYMDRANISYIAKQMMDDLGMTKPQFGLLASKLNRGS
jgi:ACS family glucarate transporter-like MFS transporter